MKLERGDITKMFLLTLIGAVPVAFTTFDFMFPNISTPPLQKNLFLDIVILIVVSIPAGYFTRRTDLALVTVLLYTFVGYLLALLLYTVPYLVYDIELLLPSFYYGLFFRVTVFLVFLYLVGGFIGAIIGQTVRDFIRKEETSLTFRPPPETRK